MPLSSSSAYLHLDWDNNVKDQPDARRILDLHTAVTEIKQACDDIGNGRSPFFFLVGAGVSSPSIPLAAAIQKDCEDKAKSLGRTAGPSPAQAPLRRIRTGLLPRFRIA